MNSLVNVTYTQESLWEAIFSVVPSFRFVKESGINVNLPHCCNTAATVFFMNGEAGNEHNAAVLRKAMHDLNSGDCCFKFSK